MKKLYIIFGILAAVEMNLGNSVQKDYHTAAHRTCTIASKKHSMVDVVCRIKLNTNTQCDRDTLKWYRHGANGTEAIEESPTYGIWHARWGIQPNELVSYLRIRSISSKELGFYKCQVECRDEKSLTKRIYTRKTDVCFSTETGVYNTCAEATTETCDKIFNDGICNKECNNAANLFDGFDCKPKLQQCHNVLSCRAKFENERCDKACDFIQCGYDGGNCFLRESEKRFRGTVVIRLKQHVLPSDLVWDLSLLLRVPVREIRHYNHKYILVPKITENYRQNKLKYQETEETFLWSDPGWSSENESSIYLRLLCKDADCLYNADLAARFIIESLKRNTNLKAMLSHVGVLRHGNECAVDNKSLLNNLPTGNPVPPVTSRQIGDSKKTSKESANPPFHQQIDKGILIGAGLGVISIVILVIGIICIRRTANKNKNTRQKDRFPNLERAKQSSKDENKKKYWYVAVSDSNETETR